MFFPKWFTVIVLICFTTAAFTQQLMLGKAPFTMNKSAVLELNADKQGLLLPRITDTAAINTLNPPDGMVIYFVPTKRLLLRTFGYWSTLAPASSTISLATGATGTDVNVSGSPVSLGGVVTLNLPSASATARGLLTSADWSTFNNKQSALTFGNLTTASGGVTITGGAGAVIGAGAAINIQNATSLQNGLLTATDWNTFSNKVSTTRTINTTAPLSGGGDLSTDRTLSMTQANASTNGWLSSVDWNTFNNKQSTGSYLTGLTGDVTATGPGTVAATIASNAVTNAKFRQSAALSVVGNTTGAMANVSDISSSADGQFLVRRSGALTFGTIASSDVPTLNQNTTGSAGSVSGTNVISNSNLAQMPASTLKANATGTAANAQDITLGAGLGFSGSTLVNTINNTNQLTNGAGYITNANVVFNNQANTYAAGMKQTFRGSAASAGASFGGALTADPTTLATGDLWYRADAGKLRYYDGTTSKYLATEGTTIAGSGTLNYLPKFTPNGTTLGNSQLIDDGTNIGVNTASPSATLDVNGDVALRIGTVTATTGENNDLLTNKSSFIRISGPSSVFTITGIAGGFNGRVIILYNATLFELSIAHENSNSLINNRIIVPQPGNSNTGSVIIPKSGTCTLIYSSIDSRWIFISKT